MKTILAYVLVIPLVQFALTLGELFGGAIGVLSSWMPDKSGTQVRGFIAGCVGAIASISYGFVVFRLLVGAGSFGIFPFLATVLPLSIPILNDFGIYRRFQEKKSSETDAFIKTEESIITAGALMRVISELVGILIGGCLFINR